jgi:predicted Zn-dependent protease
MSPLTKKSLVWLIPTLALLLAAASAADKRPEKPKTTVTQVLRADTYKQMELAQKAFEAKDYKGAESTLDVLKARQDKLNDYEKATLWNLYAAVFRSEEDNKRAIEAYGNVLRQPNLPEGLRDNALFSLAQTFFLIEDYKKSIAVMNKWFAVVQDVQPDAYILLAQAYYQLQDYPSAKAPIIKALNIARQRNQPFKENWLGLLRAVFYELKDYPNATRVMEMLTTQYPKDSYFMQLSGLYGLQGDQKKQAEMMHIAYVGAYAHTTGDLLNVARLYMAEGAPQRAVDLLKARLKDHSIALNIDTLQLLAQALSLARDVDESVPVLAKLAAMSGQARHYNYLGQAYMQQGDWNKAAEAFDAALKGKDLGNPDSIRMQLGTALYNGGKLQQAREVFRGIPPSSPNAEAAANWVKFITTEVNRNNALNAG